MLTSSSLMRPSVWYTSLKSGLYFWLTSASRRLSRSWVSRASLWYWAQIDPRTVKSMFLKMVVCVRESVSSVVPCGIHPCVLGDSLHKWADWGIPSSQHERLPCEPDIKMITQAEKHISHNIIKIGIKPMNNNTRSPKHFTQKSENNKFYICLALGVGPIPTI